MQSQLARQLLRGALRTQGHSGDELTLKLPGEALRQALRAEVGVDISISHSRNWVGVCLAPGTVGLDLEAAGRQRSWLAISQAFFTPLEAQQMAQAQAHQQEALFLHYWTLKEACIKAVGGGVFDGLNQLRVVARDQVELISDRPVSLQSVFSARYRDLMLAVCGGVGSGALKPRFWHCSSLQDMRVEPCDQELTLRELTIAAGS